MENILKFSGVPEDIENVDASTFRRRCDLINSRYGHELIGILAEHCRDPSLMVRKQVKIYIEYLLISPYINLVNFMTLRSNLQFIRW